MKVSVIVPVFNGDRWLIQSLESLFSQTLRGFEIILIDDGSQDNTPKILSKIKDSRLKVISFRRNKGIVHALNAGIKVARGKYIARHDIDDLSKHLRLEKQFDFLESHPNVHILATRAELIDEEDNSLEGVEATFLEKFNNAIVTQSDIKRALPLVNPIFHGSVMMRKDALKKAGGYNLDYQFVEDYELWLRMIDEFNFHKLGERLYVYRSHQDQVRNQKAKFLQLMTIKIKLNYLQRKFFDNRRNLKIFIQGTGVNSQYYGEIAKIKKLNVIGYVKRFIYNGQTFLGKPIISYNQLISEPQWDIFALTNIEKAQEQSALLLESLKGKYLRIGNFIIHKNSS